MLCGKACKEYECSMQPHQQLTSIHQCCIIFGQLASKVSGRCTCRYGKAGVQFFTNTKTVTTNWKSADEAIGSKAPGLAGVGTDL